MPIELEVLEPSTQKPRTAVIPSSEASDSGMVNPLEYRTDLTEHRSDYKIYCGCPCPKISAPIFAAGFVAFNPLD